jgi:hypothetical protein
MHASQRSNENHNRVKVDGCGLAHVNKFLATVTCDQGIPHGDSSHDKKSDNDHYKPFEQSKGIATLFIPTRPDAFLTARNQMTA